MIWCVCIYIICVCVIGVSVVSIWLLDALTFIWSTMKKLIGQAYRKLALQYHPDKNPGNKQAPQGFKVWRCLGGANDLDRCELQCYKEHQRMVPENLLYPLSNHNLTSFLVPPLMPIASPGPGDSD